MGSEHIPNGKPVLFAPTHSNSFLDALYLAARSDQGVHVLTRGDVFRKPQLNTLLRHFKLLPIFRQSESEDNAASKNEQTFAECQDLFRANQWALIFPEGICKHQRTVLPMKKGAAMMAHRAWSEGLDLHVIPVSISYDSLSKWGMKCDIVFNKPLKKGDFTIENFDTQSFNDTMFDRLNENFPSPHQFKNKPLLSGFLGQILYYVGWIFHFPVYFLVQYLTKRFTHGTVFHDSVALGLLSQLLPIYYLLLGIFAYFFL
jgi:1-acyl-sn-glycerol-3-phosphate acyltransferase